VGVGSGVDNAVAVGVLGTALVVRVATAGDPHAERTSSRATAARGGLML
jgi:hypothetical protein